MERTILREFRKNLRQLERLLVLHLSDDTCCNGVSVAQCHCLLAVELLEQPSQNELSDHLGIEKSTLSRTVDGLAKAGLLERTGDTQDRRIIRISLTPRGQEICNAINGTNDERYRKVFNHMTAPPEQIVASFAEFVRAMLAVQREGGRCLLKNEEEGGNGK